MLAGIGSGRRKYNNSPAKQTAVMIPMEIRCFMIYYPFLSKCVFIAENADLTGASISMLDFCPIYNKKGITISKRTTNFMKAENVNKTENLTPNLLPCSRCL